MTIEDTIREALKAAGLLTGIPVAIAADSTLAASASGLQQEQKDEENPAPPAGQFLERTYESPAGSCNYKLYLPARAAQPVTLRPLLIMLHGCTQGPDDFAAGTCMNGLADRYGFLVAYPAQSAAANGMKCWNWFRSADQMRDAGEPALLVGITREIMAEHAINPRGVLVAGMSAGAAMAVILGVNYPELYAAVGAHSGLPYRAATGDALAAMAAMRGVRAAQPSRRARAGSRARSSPALAGRFVPTIVFHGDADATVDAGNGSLIVAQAVLRAEASGRRLQKVIQERGDSEGRGVTVTTYRDSTPIPCVEHWLVHGAGHAWSGGSPDGSCTDPVGPDASTQMIRFLLSHVAEN
ncbi:MAG: PHB depolymerase family esterase [Steroidobacteraceae bacterium]